jgi:hypothetical protein
MTTVRARPFAPPIRSMVTSPVEPPPYAERDPITRSSRPPVPWHEITPYISPEYISPRTYCAIEKLYTKWIRDFIQSRNGTVKFDKGPTGLHLKHARDLWKIKVDFSNGKASPHADFLKWSDYLDNADIELFMEYLEYEEYSGNRLTDKQALDIVWSFMVEAGVWGDGKDRSKINSRTNT